VAFARRSSRSPCSRATLGLLLLTAVTLLVLDLPGTGPLQPVRDVLASVFRPIRSAGDAVLAPLGNGWKGAFRYDEIRDENAKLRAELEDAKGDEAELERLRREVKELEQLNDVEAPGLQTRTAEVIAEGASSFDQTLDIDQGSGSGVKQGMAVITGRAKGAGGGVLGRILDVQSGRSKVQLLTDPDFQIGVKIGDDRGVAKGQGRGKDLVVDSFQTSGQVEEGDFVYTSGITDSAFPGDLAVGRVAKVTPSASGLGQTIEVTPLADLSQVYVKVVLKDPPR